MRSQGLTTAERWGGWGVAPCFSANLPSAPSTGWVNEGIRPTCTALGQDPYPTTSRNPPNQHVNMENMTEARWHTCWAETPLTDGVQGHAGCLSGHSFIVFLHVYLYVRGCINVIMWGCNNEGLNVKQVVIIRHSAQLTGGDHRDYSCHLPQTKGNQRTKKSITKAGCEWEKKGQHVE